MKLSLGLLVFCNSILATESSSPLRQHPFTPESTIPLHDQFNTNYNYTDGSTKLLEEELPRILEQIPALDDLPLVTPQLQDVIDLLPLAIPLISPYVSHKTAEQVVAYGQISLEFSKQLSQVPELQTWAQTNYQKFKNYQQIMIRTRQTSDGEDVPTSQPLKYAIAETITSDQTKKFIQNLMRKALVI